MRFWIYLIICFILGILGVPFYVLGGFILFVVVLEAMQEQENKINHLTRKVQSLKKKNK